VNTSISSRSGVSFELNYNKHAIDIVQVCSREAVGAAAGAASSKLCPWTGTGARAFVSSWIRLKLSHVVIACINDLPQKVKGARPPRVESRDRPLVPASPPARWPHWLLLLLLLVDWFLRSLLPDSSAAIDRSPRRFVSLLCVFLLPTLCSSSPSPTMPQPHRPMRAKHQQRSHVGSMQQEGADGTVREEPGQ